MPREVNRSLLSGISLHMHGIANILFVACAALGAFLVAIPLPKALGEQFTHAVCFYTPGLTKRAASGNVGTSMLIIWTEFACLVQGANAIRWNGNIENWCPVWCDFCMFG